MSDLIKALSIFLKYGDPSYPTHCEHDVLTICGIDPCLVSEDDVVLLEELGFFIFEGECFTSYKFGSS